MKAKIRWLFFSLCLIEVTKTEQPPSLDGSRTVRDAGIRDARAILGSSGIGPSFRGKRDNAEVNDHALKAETNALASAAESVAAAEDSLVAGIEAEQARQAIGSDTRNHENDTGEEDEEIEETDTLTITDTETKQQNGQELASLLKTSKDGQLQKLMSDSSVLAKELRVVFDVLSKRESQLVNEMESLKGALTEAVAVLKQSSTSLNQRNRREYVNVDDQPYKACVYIESIHDVKPLHSETLVTQYPPEPIVKEFIPDEYEYYDDITYVGGKSDVQSNQVIQNSQSAASYTDHLQNDIDLSKVFWLKLPGKMDDATAHQKVNTVFEEVNAEGKDALIIPVPRGYTTSHQVSQGFLQAIVGKNPKLQRKLRSLKMNIKEIKL